MNLSTPSSLIVEIAIEPKSDVDAQRLADALREMQAEDGLFRAAVCGRTSQILLKSPDEEQLDTKIRLLRQTYGIDLTIGTPQVAFRETITGHVAIEYAHKRLTAGSPEFAKVEIIVEPNDRGEGNLIGTQIDAETIPKIYLPVIAHGIETALESGVIAGCPVTDVKIRLTGGACRESESSSAAFEIAARAACRQALIKGNSRLIEPFMSVEVHAPEAYAGNIKGDLVSRRGIVSDIAHNDGQVTITADVPMINMFGYQNQLRAFTQGSGTFTMRYKEYRLVDNRGNPNNPPPAAAAALRA
jgi:elongation factor G